MWLCVSLCLPCPSRLKSKPLCCLLLSSSLPPSLCPLSPSASPQAPYPDAPSHVPTLCAHLFSLSQRLSIFPRETSCHSTPLRSYVLFLAPEITSLHHHPPHIPLTVESPRVPRNWGREEHTPPSGFPVSSPRQTALELPFRGDI